MNINAVREDLESEVEELEQFVEDLEQVKEYDAIIKSWEIGGE